MNVITWQLASKGLHRTWLTGDALTVLGHLAACIAAGQDNPTHAHLAKLAGCCARTVRRVLVIARATGFLDWAPVFRQTASGRRRCANRYWLRLPERIPARPEPSGQVGRARGRKILKQVKMAPLMASLTLLEVRKRMEMRLARAWQPRFST